MLKDQTITGIIPARFASTRFPGKPLVMLRDKPMVQWVYEGCKDSLDHLAIATDDHRIAEAVEQFGGQCIMTSPEHRTGTERCLEAVHLLDQQQGIRSDIVVNIQGDEPFIRQEQIMELLECFENEKVHIGTLRRPLSADEDPADPNIVKVVIDRAGRALCFSRAPIPYYRNRNHPPPQEYLKHIGLYAFKTSTLEEICKLSPSPLEQAESLEQLRWMEHGFEIHTRPTAFVSMGVDTPEDLEKIREQIG